MFTSGQLGISNEIDEATTTKLKKPSISHEDDLLVEEHKLLNKSIAEMFLNNHNITDKKRTGYGKNVIEHAPSMHDEAGGFFLDEYDDMDEEEEEEVYEDEEDRQTRKEFEKISQELSEQLKNSPHKNDYLDSNSKQTKDSPRISLKTGLSSEFESSRSSSRNSGESTSATSIKSSDILKIDPNYRWLLKDLKLSNNKRVIDVTDLIDLNESQEKENIITNNNNNINTSNIINDSITSDSNTNNNKENISLLKQEQKLNQSDSDNNNDSSYISKLYKKLVNTSGNNNDKTTDIEDDQVS